MDEFEKNASLVNERRITRAKEFAEQSRKRLQKIAATKIRTTFIGSLSEFEKSFGFLWGLSGEGLTAEQSKLLSVLDDAGFGIEFFREAWDNARTAVLNNGNNQMRALDQEISQYSMTWNRYHMTLPVKGQKDE